MQISNQEDKKMFDIKHDDYKPSFGELTESQVNLIYAKLYDSMVFFGYVKGVKIGDQANI